MLYIFFNLLNIIHGNRAINIVMFHRTWIIHMQHMCLKPVLKKYKQITNLFERALHNTNRWSSLHHLVL
jgi:hypothetical protein